MKKRTIRFKIAPTKPEKFDFQATMAKFAHNFMVTERKLTPLFIHKRMPVNEALVLIATYTDTMMSRKPDEHWMTQDDIIGATFLLIKLWKKGLFIPSPQFPYTLAQALEEMGEKS